MSTLETDSETCVICLSSMADMVTRSLECGHVFHEECLDHWEENSNLCPCCRKDMKQPLVALRDTLKILNDAVVLASKALVKIKTISSNAQVGHLPMAETAVRNIDEFQNNLALVAPILASPGPGTGIGTGRDDIFDILRTILRQDSMQGSMQGSRQEPGQRFPNQGYRFTTGYFPW